MSAPSAPVNPTATAGYTMAMVQWQPPDSDGGSPLTGYTVTADDLAHTSVTVTTPAGGGGPPLQAIFGGLTNGTTYSFTVTATNGDGTSVPSGASNAVTPKLLPGRLPNVLTALMGQMALDYATYSVGNPPEMWFGKQYLGEQSDGPRIVFVPKGGPWRGPTQLGNGITGPRQLWDRRPVVEAHIWGVQLPTADATQDTFSTYGVAEDLMNNLAASLHHVAPGSSIDESEAFPDADGANLSRGAAIVLRITFEIPATDYQDPTVVVTSFPQITQIQPFT